MSLIEQFELLTTDVDIRKKVKWLFTVNGNHKPFITYYGVNFNKDSIVSLKFYFSFHFLPSDEVLNKFGLPNSFIQLVKKHWKPSDRFKYVHQGLTLALKCYLNQGNVKMNHYTHFLSEEHVLGAPKYIKLEDEDVDHVCGICIEFDPDSSHHEWKQYYYPISKKSWKSIISDFNLSEIIDIKKLNSIEYTEVENKRKINLETESLQETEKFLRDLGANHIFELSTYIKDKFNLVPASPGLRLESDTLAIYYVPPIIYNELKSVNTIKQLFNV